MTPERIAEIRERLAAASPGPWAVRECEENESFHILSGQTQHLTRIEGGGTTWIEDGCNSDFIAHARQDVPDLLVALNDAQARLAAAEAELSQLRAIFSRDLLEDDAGVRAAYELGVKNGRRKAEQGAVVAIRNIVAAFGAPASDLPPPPAPSEASIPG